MAPESPSSTARASAGLAGVAERLDPAQGAVAGVVAGPLRRLVALHGQVVLLAGDVAAAQIEVGHGPAVALLEDFDGPIAAAQQIEAGAQADHAGRGVLFLGLQFRDGIAKDGVIGPVAADGRLHLADFGGSKRAVDQDCLPQVEFDALHHGRKFSLTGLGPEGIGRMNVASQSQRGESNPQPPHYECGALPIEATLAKRNPIIYPAEPRWQALRSPLGHILPKPTGGGRREGGSGGAATTCATGLRPARRASG